MGETLKEKEEKKKDSGYRRGEDPVPLGLKRGA